MNTTLRALVNQAERMVQTEVYEEAIALCYAILRRHPRYARAYRILAEAHLGLGEHGAAADLFRRALGVDPEDPVGYAGLGIIFAERGLREEAIWQLERAFELAPGRDGLRRELTRLYQERGSSGQVRLTRAALARIYTRGGLWNKAIGELRDLVAREPYRLDLHVSLARTLWRAGQHDEAARVAQTALDQAPNCLVARLVVGAYWCREGRAEEGRRLLLGARELDPEGREVARLLGSSWPELLGRAQGAARPVAAEPEPEAAVEPAAPPVEPAGRVTLPDWLEGEGEQASAEAHIATLPQESVQALLGNLAEQEAAIEGEADLPFGGEPGDEGALPEAPLVADDQAEGPPVPVTAEALFGPDAPSALLSPLSLWQRRLDTAPDDHDARLGLARALVQDGRLAEALQHYDALASQPGYQDKVLADLEALAAVNAQSRPLRELLGDAYARAGRFQDAMGMYRWLLSHGDSQQA